jgi:hypothetical protein
MNALHVTDDLIEYSKDTSVTVLYFFCSHQHNECNETSAVLRRLLLKQHSHPQDYLVDVEIFSASSPLVDSNT